MRDLEAQRPKVSPSPSLEAAQDRAIEDIRSELKALNEAHLQNESTRDAFLALAHTALFAASVSFVGDIAARAQAHILWMLLFGWAVSVVGLCALTLSYVETTRHIRRRQQQAYDPVAEIPRLANVANAIALWSFPFALISTFAFAAVNILHMSDDHEAANSGARLHPGGGLAAATYSNPGSAEHRGRPAADNAINARIPTSHSANSN